MNEMFLHYVWQHKLYAADRLMTSNGELVEVLHPGTYNRDAGPDFFNARLAIGNSVWAGNVEIHVHASDWKRHNHQSDPLYSNCILHVVWKHDGDVAGPDGRILPTLVMDGVLLPECWDNYDKLIRQDDVIACTGDLSALDDHEKNWWLERMTVERLEYKSLTVKRLLELTHGSWEEAFLIAIGRNFGFHVNAEPFERLLRSVPFNLLLRLRDRQLSLESMLLGQGGFLACEAPDDYTRRLKEEYLYLKRKYNLHALNNPGWKFLRLRPSNFPTLRIAQLAALIRERMPLFSQCMEAETLEQLSVIFCNQVSPYWQTHYRPGFTSPTIKANLGEDSIRLLLINTVVPFLFLRGKKEGNLDIGEKALWWMRFLMPEDNRIIRAWKSVGWIPENAAQSQGLLHLYANYCTDKKCLLCQLGHRVVSGTKQTSILQS